MDTRFDLQVNKKAFQINLDDRVYGTFAEIGAGQEVARRFFHVGGASHTIAKTISAYDMTFSDAIYGSSGRYVSRDRLSKMLDHEFELLHQRLGVKVGDRKTFFVFANTVAARNIRQHDEAHGWLGIRFQTAPRAPLNEIIVHVRMLDVRNIEQQEALGIIGVNLIYGAYYHYHKPEAMIASLLDDLSPERMEVDMIRLSGPDFAHIDNRLMSLQLVSQGLTKATLFQANGEVVQAADVFYKKPLLVERGSFRPVTKVTNDMLDCALNMFVKEEGVKGESPEVLMEITMQNLLSSGELDLRDFLDRIDILSALGRTVLISNYGEYYRLVNFLTRYTDGMVGLALGIPSLQEIFDEKYYTNLEGGILEGLGRLFKTGVKLFVYPRIEADGSITEAEGYTVAPNLKYLYTHLLENHFIQSIENFHKEYLTIQSREVLAKIRTGDHSWEGTVPAEVAEMIKERKLFGYT
ncbi:MAG: TonB-dependent receptor [Chthoniobacterales bacterium]